MKTKSKGDKFWLDSQFHIGQLWTLFLESLARHVARRFVTCSERLSCAYIDLPQHRTNPSQHKPLIKWVTTRSPSSAEKPFIRYKVQVLCRQRIQRQIVLLHLGHSLMLIFAHNAHRRVYMHFCHTAKVTKTEASQERSDLHWSAVFDIHVPIWNTKLLAIQLFFHASQTHSLQELWH